ncbi:outer membrane beta-barrel protein [Microbulbifer sp. SA54]|uniref:outer membrane beta-barrel protein n=1 Tax=Microbulbifer sp. SA54 TaxID=3401577 RepID=UPI003AAD0BB9
MRYSIGVFLIACSMLVAVPAAHAKGGFFIGGQSGRINLSDTDFTDDNTDIQALGLGYRWQAGRIVQVGFEVGGGKLGKLKDAYTYSSYDYQYSARSILNTSYVYAGANARFQFGAESRWFALTRIGYMGYEERYSFAYEEYDAWYDAYYSYGDSGKDSGGGVYFGIGIGVDVTSNLNINLQHSGYAYSPSIDEGYEDGFYTANSTALGLEVRF